MSCTPVQNFESTLAPYDSSALTPEAEPARNLSVVGKGMKSACTRALSQKGEDLRVESRREVFHDKFADVQRGGGCW